MTNSTSFTSSASSFFWDRYSQAQKEIFEFEQQQSKAQAQTIWSAAEKFGMPGKAAACAMDPSFCLDKIASYLAYDGPKMAFETTVSIAKEASVSIAKWAGSRFNITTPQIFEDLYNTAADQATHLSDAATSWVTDLPMTTVESRRLWEKIEPTDSCFHATDLIGPTIALAFYTNRCSNNLFEALHHAKLLVTGKRIVATSYTVPTVNSRIPTTITKTKTYTTPGLLKDIVMKVGFAALWYYGASYTYENIYNNVLEAAGGNAEHALSVVRKITFASGVAPIAYEWIKEALYAPASTDSNGQGTEAPKSQYTGPRTTAPGAAATTRIPLLRDIEHMSFDEAMKVLEERDASNAIEV